MQTLLLGFQVITEFKISFQLVLVKVLRRKPVQFVNHDVFQLVYRDKGADTGVLCHMAVGALEIVPATIF